MSLLLIASYHCNVAGVLSDSIDYQVRFFETDDESEASIRLKEEKPDSYLNSDGETVTWVFSEIVEMEHDPEMIDGAEIIGFITGKNAKQS
jgi:hypothetical protein